MSRVQGSGNGVTFTADADNVSVVWPSGATSGYVGPPKMFGVHSIECPPLPKYFSLLQDYLYTSTEASVQYLRAGTQRGQSVPEQVWAWGMGRPASKYTTHNEQTGYASMSREQWLGDPSAVGSYFIQPSGAQMQFTADMAQCMRDQINGLAQDYADWCHRHGFTPHLGDQSEILRGCAGEGVGCAFFHYQASKLPGTTTNHSDPGEGRYPGDVFIAKALAAFSGTAPYSPPAPAPTPIPIPAPIIPKDWFTMATKDDLIAALKDPSVLDAIAQRVITFNGVPTPAAGVYSNIGTVLREAGSSHADEQSRLKHLEGMVGTVGSRTQEIGSTLTGLAAAVKSTVKR